MTDAGRPRYDPQRSYQWNYDHAPEAPENVDARPIPGTWDFCGLPIASPLGIPAGPLLNGKWCLYYAALGFDVLTYKTVRSTTRECYPLPNLQPVDCDPLQGGEHDLPAAEIMRGSWAVSYGMPSAPPEVWRRDVERTRKKLPSGKLLSVSVVGTVREGWTLEQLAQDYACCADWARQAGADCIEMNFSCPNVDTCDGQLFQNPDSAAFVAQRVRDAIGRTPLIAKVGRLVDATDAARLVGALAPVVDALAMTNSIAATVLDARGKLMFEGQPRGICGAATRDASIAQTEAVCHLIQSQDVSLKLIGVGGIFHAEDAHRYLQAGAHAVQLATAPMLQPGVGLDIRRQWREGLEEPFSGN